ncbi:MAG: bifunctional methylenetetrahydrofolate dehydrogenase/methenyltetrahydrofolate cyclohydrolase FolD [Absicoccus porci]|uniref:Bifunctional protein FolD n=2 Tax=Absicoccus porci TaxID=2486576 RepID=A0A3N0I3T4_9FIRM|nr:bifunctional methylenetetrahydrofolate dehydrogenase/methenyltetrahydrofolate cyclohydrolase FolD [Absicoccus porci]MCI6087964.1 bifunctional methylenetetrahydrofolate dehydrogenase/methenyltetrahydrofolate cyclohydrolase FolD [Absicoccus porci]MDD6459693.1 bifunctional methylenetetrahydrofolate dehydrogenase/methenyltetrahydrofolate cyclohydrolase FolD [Absicoccus porci]MDD7329621.1 bifunctional methylenetetrahydrofolate dehydrogenase/methenyltetrahydrofolate cyclohydrolase FolD [Absicoccus 
MKTIWGNELANEVKDTIRSEVDQIKAEGKRLPVLAVVLVGDNPASQSYVRSKANACINVGMENRTITLDGNISQEELLDTVKKLNADEKVDGILVQLPLPKHLDADSVIMAIDPSKDVDGLHPVNAGNLLTGRPGFVPCTPKGIMYMLKSVGLENLAGKRAVVCGRSNLVGKPVALLLQNQNATVTIVHSKTPDIESICSQADILVVAMGRPKMVTSSWVKEGAVVIDVGINRMENGKLCGDVDFDDVKDKVAAISPVPKGVGPMTVCMLLSNTLEAYRNHERG